MSSEISLSVCGISKCYHIYDRPEDRLWQMLRGGGKTYYREFHALDDVSFDVAKGDALAILGRNGSGKSTLLQMICGTLTPTKGSVKTDGKIAALLELGAGFNAEFSGRENVYLNGALLGVDRKEMDAIFPEIEDFADIGEFIDQPVKTYSSGMYVRLAFAVAIHCRPDILVVDEALAVGDFLFQQKCNRFLKERFSDVTKLLVTHDMAAVANLADRAIVLHHGKLVYAGDPQSAIREYQIVARAEESQKMGLRAAAKTKQPTVQPRQEVAALEVDGDHLHNGPDGFSNDCDDGGATDWIDIPDNRLSGTLRVKLTRCKWQVSDHANLSAVRDGEPFRVDFELQCDEAIAHPIIGYQVLDRFGKVIFGENSVTSDMAAPPIAAGRSHMSLQFIWPRIAPDKYSLTLGVGTGFDSLSHTIECWAHNVIVLDVSSQEPVHGLFNVKINDLELVVT